MRRSLFIPILMVAAIFGASCGGDTVDTSDAAQSPIAEFLGEPSGFGFGAGDQEAAQAAFQEQERARQDIIAACMKEQGFDYVPVDPGDFSFFGGDDGLEPGSEEWTAKYGFGITTQRFSQDEVGPDLVGFDDSGFRDQTQDDPNQAIVNDLSEAEQEAYYAALYGNPEEDFAIDETLSQEEIDAQMEDFDFQPSGCEGEAYANDNMNRFYIDFGDELNTMYERMQADPRIVEAEKAVADCVTGKGLEYSKMDDIYQQFESDLMAIEEEIGFPGENLTEADFEQMDPEEIDAIYNTPREFSPELKARLADLQKEEITLAKAVADCGGGFEAQAKLFEEVRVEYEQQFLDDNADRLADYKAKAE